MQSRIRVTLWIHGTKPPLSGICGRFFYSVPGLALMTTIERRFWVHSIGTILSSADSDAFPLSTLYQFGWSGLLSSSHRLRAAHALYEALTAITAWYTNSAGDPPFLTIITHSHGGNVALNLARIHANKRDCGMVDRLIMLACPVQRETAYLVEDSFFRRVYSFYSGKDLMQILDPQGIYALVHNRVELGSVPLFSERRFTSTRVAQAQVLINNRHPLHVEFVLRPFLRALPMALQFVDKDSCNASCVRIITSE